MERKVILISLLIAVIVYGTLFVYVFGISPFIREKYQHEWVKEILSREVKFKGDNVCKQCHIKQYKELMAGKHATVPCEDCHGVGYNHTIYRTKQSIVINTSREACLICHEKIPGRTAIETVNVSHHAGVKCIVCHNPHSPMENITHE